MCFAETDRDDSAFLELSYLEAAIRKTVFRRRNSAVRREGGDGTSGQLRRGYLTGFAILEALRGGSWRLGCAGNRDEENRRMRSVR